DITMIVPRYCAFVDESGNTGLNFGSDGVSTHYIVVSIIVPSEKCDAFAGALEQVRAKYFQTGEIKSSNVGKKDQRRQKILEELLPLEWSCIGLVVDKRSLQSK